MKGLSESFYRGKVAQIQASLEAEGLDGVLLLDVYNVIYASGFFHTPSERPMGLLIRKSADPVLLVPLLEQENAASTWIGDIRTYFEYPGEEHAVEWMIREAGCQRLGLDRFPQDLDRALPAGVTRSRLVDKLRWVKDPAEIELVELAARYADYCLEQVRDYSSDIIRGGGTELDILAMCLKNTRAKMQAEVGEIFNLYGGSVVGTVHSGERAALPHGSPMHRPPQRGETLIAGIGAMVGGYHAESGATFIVGEPVDDQMVCLQAAKECDAAGVNALRVGNTCAQVNTAALNVLKEYGLGDAIRHRIGHGMGLQGHEAPWLAPGDETPLVPKMVFSNEPGIYRPGIDGYRTINTMIVTDGAASVPSRFLAENPPETRILTL
ncbi:MAG: aminopeptidase P family protein [Chloroflexi bacterium]|nr:aminopeptidase P family protein [Chloroflexota bacterium]